MIPVHVAPVKNIKSAAVVSSLKKRAKALFLVVDYFMNVKNSNH